MRIRARPIAQNVGVFIRRRQIRDLLRKSDSRGARDLLSFFPYRDRPFFRIVIIVSFFSQERAKSAVSPLKADTLHTWLADTISRRSRKDAAILPSQPLRRGRGEMHRRDYGTPICLPWPDSGTLSIPTIV